MSGPREGRRLDSNGIRAGPEEVFALLGNETRVAILHALWEEFESGKGVRPVGFSALFDRVDIRDSGNFSYHLEKLCGPFVRQTEEGYVLKQTGINVVRAVFAGGVTDDPEIDPTRVDLACPRCGGTVEVRYGDEVIVVTCRDCPGNRRWKGHDGLLYAGLVPPAVFDGRDIVEALHVAIRHIATDIANLHEGSCPHCLGEVERWPDVCTEHEPDPEGLCPNCHKLHLADGWLLCSVCKRSAFPPVRVLALRHPAVTTFLGNHGVTYQYASWATVELAFDLMEELRSTDPVELAYVLEVEDDSIELVVDDSLGVTVPT